MKTNTLREIIPDPDRIAFCGLYCGACRSFLSGKCPGCQENSKASWCKIRSCCIENNLKSCADCTSTELKQCGKYNPFISKVIGMMLNSDRAACISRIRAVGYQSFANEMTEMKRQSLPRK